MNFEPGPAELFQRIDELYGTATLNMEGMEVLGLSKDAWYRRRRGDVHLTFSEALLLANHFQVPLTPEQSRFEARISIKTLITSAENYKLNMEANLAQLELLRNSPSSHFTVITKDLPFFYTFLSPKLHAFKLFLWLRILYGIEEAQYWQHWDEVPKEMLDLGERLGRAYLHISITELWGRNALDGFLHQFDYCLDTGIFHSRTEALELLDELEKWVMLIHQQSALPERQSLADEKVEKGITYNMMVHDLLIPDNQMLAEIPGTSLLFLPMAGHYLPTDNQVLTDFMKDYLKKQFRQSQKITGGSEKTRNSYFMKMRQQINQKKENVQKMDPFPSRW